MTQTGIVTITQVEPITVIFTAPEDQLPYISEGQKAGALKVIAFTTDGKKTLAEGKLAVINNQVDTTSGTIRLKAVFDNKDHALWPGQSVSTRLLVRTLKDATVVPDDAVQHSTNGLYAYTVNQDNKAEVHKIKVSYGIDGRSVVDEGCHRPPNTDPSARPRRDSPAPCRVAETAGTSAALLSAGWPLPTASPRAPRIR